MPSSLSDMPMDRDSSPELGDATYLTSYSKKTGRPIRKSAGKVQRKAGFVDSSVIEDEYEEPIETPSEDEDVPMKQHHKRKRKRSPSPEPPPLDDVIRIEDPGDLSDHEGPLQKKPVLPPVKLQFNIPLGFHGPLYVTLDRSMLGMDKTYDTKPRQAIKQAKSQPQSTKAATKRAGFCDLPAELRNKVYRHLFVVDDVLEFPADKATAYKNSFKRSAQFLSTCRLVYSEGCSVLYGENKFQFDRNGTTRGSYWEAVPKEIGYKDIRLFLKTIGPENLLYLRDITLKLQDAMPGATPELDHDQRRYIRDAHLLDVIRTLRNTKLRKLNVIFLGRRALTRSDSKFIDYLTQVKADEVISSLNGGNMGGWWCQKIEHFTWHELKDTMTRKKKLYIP